MIIAGSVSDEEAKAKYPDGWKAAEAVPQDRSAAENISTFRCWVLVLGARCGARCSVLVLGAGMQRSSAERPSTSAWAHRP